MPSSALELGRILLASLIATMPARAQTCDLPLQGHGRVAAVIDARTVRLDDGRDLRLAGLAPLSPDHAFIATSLLEALVTGRAVAIHAASDMPDRYGRQSAWPRLDADGPAIQSMLAAQGGALADIGPNDMACADEVRTAEADARRTRQGLWADRSVIKNAESPDDILAGVGHFAIVEGRVRSVRPSGSVTYVNFGRRWTRDFAVTMPSGALPSFDAAGLPPSAFTGKRLRVRGFIERRGGLTGSPRIEAVRPGQIEIVGADDPAISRE